MARCESYDAKPELLRKQIKKNGAEYVTYLVDRFQCWLFLDDPLYKRAKKAIAEMREITERTDYIARDPRLEKLALEAFPFPQDIWEMNGDEMNQLVISHILVLKEVLTDLYGSR